MMTIHYVKLVFITYFGCLFLQRVLSQDTEPPQITNCPLNTFVSSSPNRAFWVAPTATDNGGSVALTSNVESGSYFPPGQTQVTYTATDGQGLQSQCVFSIFVSGDIVNSIPIVENCPDDITTTLGTGETSTSISWIPPFATDPDVPVTRTSSKQPGDEFSVGIAAVKYTFVDSTNLGIECVFTVEVKEAASSDTTPPTFTYCPNDITIQASDSSSTIAATWTEPVATDNSGTVFYSNTHTSGDGFPVGSTNVVYTAVDRAGNRASCTFTITVSGDNTAPTFTYCPNDIASTVEEGTSITAVTWTEPTAIDDSGNVLMTRTHASGDLFSVGSTTVTYFARDSSQNIETCTFVVTVSVEPADTTSPVFVDCPDDISATVIEGTTILAVNWTEPTAIDNSDNIFYTKTHAPGDQFAIGSTTVTYFARDTSQNQAICAFNVTVSVAPGDTTSPVFINCPDDISATVTEGINILSVNWTEPTAIDDSDNVFYTKTHAPGDRFAVGSTTVTYFARDPSQNQAICAFTVTVSVVSGDTTSPVFTYCPNDISATVIEGTSSSSVAWSEPTAIDDSDNVFYTKTHAPGDQFTIGSTTVTYFARDPSQNQAVCAFTVTVSVAPEDSTPPSFTYCPDDISVTLAEGTSDTSVTWTEPVAVDDSGSVIYSHTHSSGDLFSVGSQTVSYFARDSSRNQASCSFTVSVIRIEAADTTAPIFTSCPSNLNSYAVEGATSHPVTWQEPVAIDNSDSVSYTKTHSSGDQFAVGTTTVSYFATDPSGNQATCAFTVTIIVNLPPTTNNCPSDQTIQAAEGVTSALATWTVPTFTDELGPVVATSVFNPGETFPVDATTIVTYTAIDSTGLQGTCTFNLVVVGASDTTPPVFTFCPDNLSGYALEGESGTTLTWREPEATDNSGSVTYDRTHSSGDHFGTGRSLVEYIAIDDDGNTARCAFTVTIIVNQRPSSDNCPSDQLITAALGTTSATAIWTEPTFTDEFGPVEPTSNFEPGDVFQLGATVVTYTAVDITGLQGTCLFQIIVEEAADTAPPVFLYCPNDITEYVLEGSTSTTVTWLEPTAFDNSGSVVYQKTKSSGSTFLVGESNVVYLARDPSGNTASCAFTVTVTVNNRPATNNCPSDQTIPADNGITTAIATWDVPIFVDDSGIITPTSNYQPGDRFDLGTTVIIYSAIDPTGTEGTCLFTVTIEDTQDPQVFNCPSDITIYLESGVFSSTVTWDEPVALDNDDVDTLVSNYNSPVTLPAGEYQVVYIARDPSGNKKECIFQVFIGAREAPTFIDFPEHKLYDTDPGLPTAIVTWTAPTATSPYDPQPTVTSNHDPGDVFPVGVTTVTYIAVDAFDAVTTQEFTVTVTDNEDPQMQNCPSDFTVLVSPGGTSATASWIAPTAVDNVGVRTFISNYESPHVFPVGDREIVYVATDDAGNFDDCSFVIFVTEREPPSFVDFPANQNVFNDPGLPSAVVTWTEPSVIYSSEPAPTVISSHKSGDEFLIGVTEVTYTAVDGAGLVTEEEFEITVIDNEDPVIPDCPISVIDRYAPATNTVPIEWERPTATDNSGDVTLIGNSEPGDEFGVGFHLVTYIAVDAANNQASCTFILNVIEDTPPVLANLPSTTVVNTDPGQPGAIVTWSMPTATDDRSTPSVTLSHESGTLFPIGTTTVTVTALDGQGLMDVHMFQITVTDNEDPVITGCSDIIVTVAPGENTAIVEWTPPTATDNSGEVTVSGSHDPGDEFLVGSSSIAYLAADSSNNQASCAMTITVRELGYPVFTNCPTSIFVGTETGRAYAIVTWPVVIATDELDTPIVVSSHDPGDSFSVGVTTVVYTATDTDDLAATCSFDVTVSDLEKPVIANCPSDISMHIIDVSKTARVWWTEPAATDNVGPVEISSTDRPGDSFPEGESVVIYVAQDGARNSYTCTFTVDLVIPSATTAYNGSLSLDRIDGTTISADDGNGVLTDDLMSDLDSFFRSTDVGDDFVGLDDMTVTVINPIGVAALKFSLHVTEDSAHSASDIETTFDDTLSSNRIIDDGNRVVAGTFLVGPGPCADDPCDRGSCERVGRENYYCVCPTGWSGFRCDNDVDECEEEENPCDGDNFQCVNSDGSYSCICQAGYYEDGDTCIESRNFASCVQLERINNQAVQYTPELTDTRSDNYLELTQEMKNAIDSIFSDHTDYFESSILSFAPGSNIQVCYQVHFHGNSQITEDLVLEEFRDDVSNSGEITNSNVYVKSSSIASTSEVCPVNYCEDNGDCYLDRDAVVQKQSVVSACNCKSGYTGANCSTVTIFTTFVIIVIAFVSAIILILLFVCIFCCILNWGDKQNKPMYMPSYNGSNQHRPVPTITVEDGDMGGGERVHVVGGGPVNPSVEGVESGTVSEAPSCVRFMDQGVVNTGRDSPEQNWSPRPNDMHMTTFHEEVVPPPPMLAAPPPPPPPPPPQTVVQPIYYQDYQEQAPQVEYIYTNYPPPQDMRGHGGPVYYSEPPRKTVVRKKRKSRKSSRKHDKVLVTSYPEGYQQVVIDGNPNLEYETRRSRKSKRLVPVGSVKPSVRRTKKSRPVQRAYTQQRGGDYYVQKGYDGENIPMQYIEDGFRPDAINPVTSGPRFIALNESFRSNIDYMDTPGLQTVPEEELMRSYSYSSHAPPPPPPPPPPPAMPQGPSFKSDYGIREKQGLEPPLYSAVDRQASLISRQQRASRRTQNNLNPPLYSAVDRQASLVARQQKDSRRTKNNLHVEMDEMQYGGYGAYTHQRRPSDIAREHEAVWGIPPKPDDSYDDEGNHLSEDYF